jgi:hypothetical protein
VTFRWTEQESKHQQPAGGVLDRRYRMLRQPGLQQRPVRVWSQLRPDAGVVGVDTRSSKIDEPRGQKAEFQVRTMRIVKNQTNNKANRAMKHVENNARRAGNVLL